MTAAPMPIKRRSLLRFKTWQRLDISTIANVQGNLTFYDASSGAPLDRRTGNRTGAPPYKAGLIPSLAANPAALPARAIRSAEQVVYISGVNNSAHVLLTALASSSMLSMEMFPLSPLDGSDIRSVQMRNLRELFPDSFPAPSELRADLSAEKTTRAVGCFAIKHQSGVWMTLSRQTMSSVYDERFAIR